MFSTRPWNELREEVPPEPNLTSKYMECTDLPSTLNPGDLVEFNRNSSSGHSFKDWFVYEGVRDGKHHVIHYTNNRSGKEEVRSLSLEEAAAGRKGRRNNGWDERWTPLSQDEVVKRAHEQMESSQCSLTSNEHFALECRYGNNWMEPTKWTQPMTFSYGLEMIGKTFVVAIGIPVMTMIYAGAAASGWLMEKCKNARNSEKPGVGE